MVSNHKPLPITSSFHVVCYTVFLMSYNCGIDYENTTNYCIADGLSRVPLQSAISELPIRDGRAHRTGRLTERNGPHTQSPILCASRFNSYR